MTQDDDKIQLNGENASRELFFNSKALHSSPECIVSAVGKAWP